MREARKRLEAVDESHRMCLAVLTVALISIAPEYLYNYEKPCSSETSANLCHKKQNKNKTNSVALSPRANYTD
jgi:hypothetical protein